MIAFLGFDFVMVDTQHSQVDSEKLIPLLQAIKLGGAKSFIRLESPDDRSGIQHAFDCGVDGILCPFIRTADDVKKIVEVSKYPGRLRKEGTRSLYVNLRPTFYAGSGPGGMLATYNKMNAKTIVAIQIETAESIDNIAEILSVPGVDIAFIGPGDLASSMGIMCKDPFKFSTDSELNRATDTVLEACLLHKVIPGCWAIDPKSSSDKGFKFMCVGSDMEFLRVSAVYFISFVLTLILKLILLCRLLPVKELKASNRKFLDGNLKPSLLIPAMYNFQK